MALISFFSIITISLFLLYTTYNSRGILNLPLIVRKGVKFMSELASIPWNLLMPLIVLQFILMIVALVDVIRHRRTNGPFIMWIFIIVLGNLIGSILYFIFGRRQV